MLRVPVFLCHPLDALEGSEVAEGRPAGVLYLSRLGPDADAPHRRGISLSSSPMPDEPHRVSIPDLWIRLRYAFLVVGGTPEDELGVLATVLTGLHSRPYVSVRDLDEQEGEEGDILPLHLIEDPAMWREIGLEEHRLSACFEVSVPLSGGSSEVVDSVLERDFDVRRPGADGVRAPSGGVP